MYEKYLSADHGNRPSCTNKASAEAKQHHLGLFQMKQLDKDLEYPYVAKVKHVKPVHGHYQLDGWLE